MLYFFEGDKPIQNAIFRERISPLGELEFFDSRRAVLRPNGDIEEELGRLLFPLHADTGANFGVLCAHRNGELARKLVSESRDFYPNQIRYESDLIFKELTFGNYSSFPLLSREFRGVPSDILLTVGTYLRMGLDGKKSAEILYIHRNTFLYRINKFIEMTGLDIREYHNALLLELYFQLATPGGHYHG